MLNRHYLEAALEKAIDANNTSIAKGLIALIGQSINSNLLTVNAQGRSFFLQALIKDEYKIATILLETLQHHPDILFKSDEQHRKPFLEAARRGYVDIVSQLIGLSEKLSPDQEGHKVWYTVDNDVNTILHIAAKSKNLSLLKLTLNKINNVLFINFPNREGKTALHESCSPEIVTLLIEHGADNLADNEGTTPFDLFLKRTTKEQYVIFRVLSPYSQQCFLRWYRDALIKPKYEKELDRLKQAYFKCAGLFNLKEMMIAHHEFNELVQKIKRMQYIKPVQHKEEQKEEQNVEEIIVVEYQEHDIPPEICNVIPRYVKSIQQDAKLSFPSNKPSFFKLREYDRLFIRDLIMDIRNYINVLNQRPKKRDTPYEVIAAVMFLSCLIAYAAILNELNVKYVSYQHDIELENTTTKNNGAQGCFFIFGFIGLSILAYFFIVITNYLKSYLVSQQEWGHMIERLQIIVERLQLIEKSETPTKTCLPTTQYNLRTLENQLLKLNGVQIEINRLMRILKDLDVALTALQGNVNVTMHPLSLFSQTQTQTQSKAKPEQQNSHSLTLTCYHH